MQTFVFSSVGGPTCGWCRSMCLMQHAHIVVMGLVPQHVVDAACKHHFFVRGWRRSIWSLLHAIISLMRLMPQHAIVAACKHCSYAVMLQQVVDAACKH